MNFVSLRFPEGRGKALTLSYDDGVAQDVRLIGLLKKYGIKGTFNLNTSTFREEGKPWDGPEFAVKLTEKEAKELYNIPEVEVAIHSSTHSFLNCIPGSVAMQQILDDRYKLEHMFGHIVRGMAYPFGTFNNSLIGILKDAGVVYARTVQSHHSFDMPEDWLRLGATCHHKDPELMNLARTFIETKPRLGPFLFYLWGHSYEFDLDDNWDVIEGFLAFMSNHEEIWYATNIEIYEYAKAYERLVFSADGGLVYNPTSTAVWICVDNKTVKVPGGKTVSIS